MRIWDDNIKMILNHCELDSSDQGSGPVAESFNMLVKSSCINPLKSSAYYVPLAYRNITLYSAHSVCVCFVWLSK
jgi:hypothetical protein